MKILLVNNHTQHLKELNRALSGHDVEIQVYQPGLNFKDEGKDLVILSGGGGEGLEIDDLVEKGKLWHEDQMEFILKTKTPIMGICMGFEVIAKAFGRSVDDMGSEVEGYNQINLSRKRHNKLGPKQIEQYEAHQWHITEAPRGFNVLADSPTGIQMIKHRNRQILATQFHPEKGGTLNLQNLLKVA